MSISSFSHVFTGSITPMYTGKRVSWLLTCQLPYSVLQACFTPLNFRSWSNGNVAWLDSPSDWHLVLGASRIMFTSTSKNVVLMLSGSFEKMFLLIVSFSLKMSLRTLLAAWSKHVASASLPSQKASEIIYYIFTKRPQHLSTFGVRSQSRKSCHHLFL